jgi:DNA invertase Pin-like site-specific DNA recombinase
VADLVVKLRELTDLGLGLVSLTESLDVATATDRAMAALRAVVTKFEREVMRERVRAELRSGEERGPLPRPAADGDALARGCNPAQGRAGAPRVDRQAVGGRPDLGAADRGR